MCKVNFFTVLFYHFIEKISKALEELAQISSFLRLPNEHDMQISMLSLARLQHIYQLPVQDLAQGIIGSRQTEAKLNSYDCQEIAESRIAQKFSLMHPTTDKEFALAVEWAEVALE